MMHGIVEKRVTSCALIQTWQEVEPQWSMSFYLGVIFCVWTFVCIVVGCFLRGCFIGDGEKKTMMDVSTQCNILALETEEIEKMTIQAIRTELRVYSGAVDGNKGTLVTRLQWFRRKVADD